MTESVCYRFHVFRPFSVTLLKLLNCCYVVAYLHIITNIKLGNLNVQETKKTVDNLSVDR